jgi:UDP-N-acetylmuramate-alanine ligase
MQVYQSGKLLGSMTMKVPGEHNKMNALAAVAVAMELGKSFDEVSCSSLHFCWCRPTLPDDWREGRHYGG